MEPELLAWVDAEGERRRWSRADVLAWLVEEARRKTEVVVEVSPEAAAGPGGPGEDSGAVDFCPLHGPGCGFKKAGGWFCARELRVV